MIKQKIIAARSFYQKIRSRLALGQPEKADALKRLIRKKPPLKWKLLSTSQGQRYMQRLINGLAEEGIPPQLMDSRVPEDLILDAGRKVKIGRLTWVGFPSRVEQQLWNTNRVATWAETFLIGYGRRAVGHGSIRAEGLRVYFRFSIHGGAVAKLMTGREYSYGQGLGVEAMMAFLYIGFQGLKGAERKEISFPFTARDRTVYPRTTDFRKMERLLDWFGFQKVLFPKGAGKYVFLFETNLTP